MDSKELILSSRQPYDLASSAGKEDLRNRVMSHMSYVVNGDEVEHSNIISHFIHAAHFTHFLGNPKDLKDGYIDDAVQFIRRANPPIDYLIGDREFDLAIYIRDWLYHETDGQFRNRFLSSLEKSLSDISKKSETYSNKLKEMIDNERGRVAEVVFQSIRSPINKDLI